MKIVGFSKKRWMRSAKRGDVFGGWARLFWLLPLLLSLWSCDQPDSKRTPPQAVEQALLKASSVVDSLAWYLPIGHNAEQSRDSVLDALLPLMLGDPAERKLEEWYEIRLQWERYFVDLTGLVYCINRRAKTLRIKQPGVAAKLFLSSGRLCNLDGDHLRSTKNNQLAYEIAGEVGDSAVMGWALAQLATPLVFSKDSASAMGYLNQALEIAEATNNAGLKAGVLIRKGAAHAHVGDFTGLLTYNEEAFRIAQQEQLDELKQNALINIGFSYNNLGRPEESIALIRENFEQLETAYSALDAGANYIIYGAQLAMQDFSGAEVSINRTCTVSDSLEFFLGMNFCRSGQAALYEAKGDLERALHYSKAYYSFREEKLSSKAQSNMRALQLQQLDRQQKEEIKRIRQEEEKEALKQKVRRDQILGLAGVGVLLLLSILAYVIGRNKIEDAQRRKESAELKLQGLRAQMNPHFMFNAINGIQNQILKSNKIEAYGQLGKFADLLRMVTKSGASFRISLRDEVQFLRTYLDLEKLRFRDGIDFTVHVDPAISDLDAEIPSMLIQPFVENAIIHGLSVLPYPGKLTVAFMANAEGVICKVTDNGRGRKAGNQRAEEREEDHLSITSKNTAARVYFLRESGYHRAAVKIEDLYEKNKPVGTEVKLQIPFLLSRKKIS